MPRILVADDNTNIQRMVSLAFQERGVEVTSVGNGEAAVRRVPDLNPDIILADIFMPVRNGYEVCEWIKKDQKYAHIPVILLVGAFDPLDEKEARRVGADGILKKPFIPPDPLIAMVTATLEKNPKFAAEMAKAKEGVAAGPVGKESIETPAATAVRLAPPPPPPPAPKVPPQVHAQIPAPIEVAPVTDDSADDASLAYGFGAGHRDMDDDGHDETAAARAPKSEFEKHGDEEFDGASTTSDWRRSAMSFEVSEEDARRPAFSDEDLEPAPIEAVAESVVEPIVESMPAIEPLPGAVIDLSLEAEPAPLTEADLKAPDSWQILPDDAPVSAEGDQHSEWASDVPDVPSTPYPVAASEPHAEVHAEVQAEPHVEAQVEAPLVAEVEVSSTASAESEAPAQVEVAAESIASSPAQTVEPEPGFAAKASHWMDAMGSAPSQPQSDWLTIIHTQQKGAVENAQASAKLPVAEISAMEPADESHVSAVSVPAADATENHSAEHEIQSVSNAPVDTPEPIQVVSSEAPVAELAAEKDDHSVSQEEDEWFFADDEPKNAPKSESVIGAVASSVSGKEAANPQDTFEATVSEPVPVSSLHEETEFVEEEIAAPIASRDSELIEPPAVHVKPEPLLVDEHSPKASGTPYGGHTDQEIAPAYTFLPPVEANVDSASSTRAEAAEQSHQQSEEDESVLPSFGETHSANGESLASASHLEKDALPAYVPPAPTREQLAHIPFMNPPPEFEKQTEKNTDNAVAQMTLDAVVQRILEKIEPQLQDLLSQNLKPLIENLIHTEIRKHDQ